MARLALDETVEFDKTINSTIQLLKQWNMLDNTLIIVTSDHSSSLAINGYAKRGSSIFDVAGKSQVDDVKYTTLTYSIGYALSPVYTKTGIAIIRQDPSISKTTSHYYAQQVGIPEDTGVHSGGDVAVYAQGKYFDLKINKTITHSRRSLQDQWDTCFIPFTNKIILRMP